MQGSIQIPTLLLDKEKCMRNIERMKNKCDKNGVTLSPHFKTHQSKFVGRILRNQGIRKITVSSIGMARYFAEDGWDDITVAFPTNIREIESICELAGKVKLTLLAQNNETLSVLSKELKHPVGIWIKIDVGMGRTGFLSDQKDELDQMIIRLYGAQEYEFKGFLAHAGHSYEGGGIGRMKGIHASTMHTLKPLKGRYDSIFRDIKFSVGDTPCYSRIDNFQDVDELRAGNFVFYDLVQAGLGSCQKQDIAVAMACPIVALHASRQEAVIYGGAIHFSKDHLKWLNRENYYGILAEWDGMKWNAENEESYIRSLSQEHGVLKCSPTIFNKLRIGDVVPILPIHSCLTAQCMKGYLTTEHELADHY